MQSLVMWEECVAMHAIRPASHHQLSSVGFPTAAAAAAAQSRGNVTHTERRSELQLIILKTVEALSNRYLLITCYTYLDENNITSNYQI